MKVKIFNKIIGEGERCFIVAEVGVNHNGDVNLAKKLIDAAKQAGVDAVKFQSFITEELVTPEAPKAGYQIKNGGKDKRQYHMLKALELSTGHQNELAAYCRKQDTIFLSTPYDWQSVDFLESLDVAAYKIASTDVTNVPFLRYIGQKRRPVILSTGMSTLGEVEEAVNTLRGTGLDEIILLHCTSEYPVTMEEVNLRAIETLRYAFRLPVGFSDHTLSIGASPWAVTLGACLIEKHFTLDRNLPGPDHKASVEPDELTELVQVIRQVEIALGDGIKRPMPSELTNKYLMQKSLVVRREIPQGGIIKKSDLTCKRPATGLSPYFWDKVIGKKAARALKSGEILTFACIKW